VSTRTRGYVARTRTSITASGAAAILVLSLGVAVAPSGASSSYVSASPSAFCTSIISYHAKAPSGTNYASYRSWAKTNLPFFQKLASQAPNAASKTVLNELATIIKYEASTSNYKALGAYLVKNKTQWANGWKAFAAAVLNCAKSYL